MKKMAGQQESSVSTSVSVAAEESKHQPQPRRALIKEHSSNSYEEKLSLFEKNCRLMYDAFSDSSEKLKKIKSTMIKNLKEKIVQMNADLTDLIMEHQQPEEDRTQIFQQLELEKPKLQATNEKMQCQAKVETEMRSRDKDLPKHNLNRNEKRMSDLDWKNKFYEKVASMTRLLEIQRNNMFLRQVIEMKRNQLKNISSQIRDAILQLLSLDDDTSKTNKEQELEIMHGKLKKILDELLMLSADQMTTNFHMNKENVPEFILKIDDHKFSGNLQ